MTFAQREKLMQNYCSRLLLVTAVGFKVNSVDVDQGHCRIRRIHFEHRQAPSLATKECMLPFKNDRAPQNIKAHDLFTGIPLFQRGPCETTLLQDDGVSFLAAGFQRRNAIVLQYDSAKINCSKMHESAGYCDIT